MIHNIRTSVAIWLSRLRMRLWYRAAPEERPSPNRTPAWLRWSFRYTTERLRRRIYLHVLAYLSREFLRQKDPWRAFAEAYDFMTMANTAGFSDEEYLASVEDSDDFVCPLCGRVR